MLSLFQSKAVPFSAQPSPVPAADPEILLQKSEQELAELQAKLNGSAREQDHARIQALTSDLTRLRRESARKREMDHERAVAEQTEAASGIEAEYLAALGALGEVLATASTANALVTAIFTEFRDQFPLVQLPRLRAWAELDVEHGGRVVRWLQELESMAAGVIGERGREILTAADARQALAAAEARGASERERERHQSSIDALELQDVRLRWEMTPATRRPSWEDTVSGFRTERARRRKALAEQRESNRAAQLAGANR